MTSPEALSALRLELSCTRMTPLILTHLFWGSRVTSYKSLLIKKTQCLSTSTHQSSLRHTAKPLDQDGSQRVKPVPAAEPHTVCCWSVTRQRAMASLKEMTLILNDIWFIKSAVVVTHSLGGLRSSVFVSKNFRTSSLWVMWVGSFIRACGQEKEGESMCLWQKHILKSAV